MPVRDAIAGATADSGTRAGVESVAEAELTGWRATIKRERRT